MGKTARPLACALALQALAARAQVPRPEDAPRPAPPPAADAQVVGAVSGAVRGLNLRRGTITVQEGQGTATLNADPGQLAPLEAGDPVSLPYVRYDGALWLAPGATRGEIGRGPLHPVGKLVGTIRALQRAQGTLTLRGITFRVHPARLEGLAPGQRVAITFGQIGETSWISELTPLAGRRAPVAPPEDTSAAGTAPPAAPPAPEGTPAPSAPSPPGEPAPSR